MSGGIRYWLPARSASAYLRTSTDELARTNRANVAYAVLVPTALFLRMIGAIEDGPKPLRRYLDAPPVSDI